ncbi:MAG: hypothetical protein ACO35C_04410 [Pontimonas sp.]
MSAYVDDLLSQPLNGLASATEIMNEQYDILTSVNKPLSSSELDVDAFKAVPASISDAEKPLYELKSTVSETFAPSTMETMPSMTDLIQQTTTPAPESTIKDYFDGPKRTGKTIGSVAEQYGLPTSFQQTIDDAQDAVLGITKDLVRSGETKTSVSEIITKDNRLRGIGMLLIITAILGFFIKILAGT